MASSEKGAGGMKTTATHWEHGYRSHGFYISAKSLTPIAWVGLTPPGFKREYGCYINPYTRIGETDDLRKAKRMVEKYLRDHNLIPEEETA